MCSERTERCVDKHGVVQLCRRVRNVYRFHLFERAEWMTFTDQLTNRPLMQCARDEQYDVVDHV